MARLTYLDFDLHIERAGEKYRARVLSSPFGQSEACFELPFNNLELENLYLRIGRTRKGRRHLNSDEMRIVKEYGKRLFEHVFTEEVLICFHSSLALVRKENKGLRIRLRLASPELHDLPWEYLWIPSTEQFLSLSIYTPIVRYLELPESIPAWTVTPPLKILVMISSPHGYDTIDVEEEWEKLNGSLISLSERNLVSLDRLEQATLTALQQALRKNEYHIFHFIGHGYLDEQRHDGILLLEDNQKYGKPLNGHYLGTLLHDHFSLRLAILNACEGARTLPSDPYAGVAQSLVQMGIPAVIAMQFEITDNASITFAREFYAAIADGYPVDAALTEARKSIFSDENDIEWGTPVLFTRSTDGRVFDVLPQTIVEKPGTISEHEENLRLGQLYQEGENAFNQNEWERAQQLYQKILSIRPEYPGVLQRLNWVEQQLMIKKSCTEAQVHIKANQWVHALEILEPLSQDFPNNNDIATALREVRNHISQGEKTPAHQQRQALLFGLLLLLGFSILFIASQNLRVNTPKATLTLTSNSQFTYKEASSTDASSPVITNTLVLTSSIADEGAPIVTSSISSTIAISPTLTRIPIAIGNLDQLAAIQTIKAHDNRVTSVAFSPDGRFLASGSDDNTVRVWSVPDWSLIYTLVGHSMPVLGVEFSPDNQYIASGSIDGTIRLWNANDGSSLTTLEGHTKLVRDIAFSLDGSLLASGSEDNTVRIWQIPDGTQRYTLKRHSKMVVKLAFSPDGQILSSGSTDTLIRLWRVMDGELMDTIYTDDWILTLDYSPNGENITWGTNRGIVRKYEFSKKESNHFITTQNVPLNSAVYNPDGTIFITAGQLKNIPTITLWDASTAELLSQLGVDDAEAVRDVTMSTGGDLIAAAFHDGSVRLWGIVP